MSNVFEQCRNYCARLDISVLSLYTFVMPKDALTIYRGACELDFLCGGKVDKVTMPDGNTLILLIHTRKDGNHRLLLSCDPSLPRAHITVRQYVNPEVATGTLMYFRKRLVGATLTDVVKDKTERMLTLGFSAFNELKEPVEYSLAVELTGKCANIIFIENGVIGNCLRRIFAEAPGKRAVLPGLSYSPPNATGRVGIFDSEELKSRVCALQGMSARVAVNKCVAGLAPVTVDELFFRLNISDDTAPSESVCDAFIDAAKAMYDAPLEPTVSFDDKGKPLDYFTVPYSICGGNNKHYATLNRAMDEYYSALFAAADLAAYSKPLRAAVRSAIAKNKKRLEAAIQKLDECSRCDTDRLYGELITANIYRIKRGDACATLENYYADNAPITIPLDPSKNAQANAAAYYKSYAKKKKAVGYAQAAEKSAQDMLFALDAISLELELCTERRELDEVRAELVDMGLIRPDTKKKKQKPVPSEPYCFDIDGATLYVGKNHAQNDRLTHTAARTDIWLHVKDVHGSHAVLKTAAPTDAQLLRAAEIAAYYSRARGSDHVAVDYTQIKFVYPHGGGRVDYKEYKTLYVTPRA